MRTIGVLDVARRAGVSPGTVSNYLNVPEKVAAATAERIQNAIDELGYVSNIAARQLRQGSSTTIGHLTIELNNPFFAAVAEGVERSAAAAGYSVFLANSAGDGTRQQRYLDLFEAQRVRGLVISATGDVTARLLRLRDRGIPAVVLDQTTGGDVASSLVVDDVAGGALAVRHLVERGARSIAFVGGPLSIETVRFRLQGAREVAEAHGAELRSYATEERNIAAGRAVGERLATLPGAERPRAVFAANDLIAIGVMHALLQRGLRVPDDVMIVGYDDIEFAADALIPLSSVRRPGVEFGDAAIEILLRRLDSGAVEGEHRVFAPELVARASTGA